MLGSVLGAGGKSKIKKSHLHGHSVMLGEKDVNKANK